MLSVCGQTWVDGHIVFASPIRVGVWQPLIGPCVVSPSPFTHSHTLVDASYVLGVILGARLKQ